MRLRFIQNSIRFFKYAVLLLAAALCSTAYAFEKIELADIYRYGKNLANTKVLFEGVIVNAEQCRLESNKEFYCLRAVEVNGAAADWVLVTDGKYDWRLYKHWLDNKIVLIFRGSIQMREGSDAISGLRSVSPVFIVQDISPRAAR